MGEEENHTETKATLTDVRMAVDTAEHRGEKKRWRKVSKMKWKNKAEVQRRKVQKWEITEITCRAFLKTLV